VERIISIDSSKSESKNKSTNNGNGEILDLNEGIVSITKENLIRVYKNKGIPLPTDERLREMSVIISGVPISDKHSRRLGELIYYGKK
jgi:hypothetical protein